MIIFIQMTTEVDRLVLASETATVIGQTDMFRRVIDPNGMATGCVDIVFSSYVYRVLPVRHAVYFCLILTYIMISLYM